jgi:hypothetical protein
VVFRTHPLYRLVRTFVEGHVFSKCRVLTTNRVPERVCTPLDSLFALVVARTYDSHPASLEELRQQLQTEWSRLSREQIERAFQGLRLASKDTKRDTSRSVLD